MDLFVTIARLNPYLMQVRYLDTKGNEVIRINRDRCCDPVYVVPPGKLQKKGHRYYFQEVMKQPPGTLWHSPLDLNVEGKDVESPQRPTIRIATAVAEEGKLAGVVIINLLMHDFLEEWRKTVGFDLYLADSNGNVLLYPDGDHDWTDEEALEKEGLAIPSFATDDPDFLYITSFDFGADQQLRLMLQVPKTYREKMWRDYLVTMGWGLLILVLFSILLTLPVARLPERLYTSIIRSNRKLGKTVNKKTAELEVLNGQLTEKIKETTFKNEELTNAYENAARAAKARSGFLGVVSHELRTPLNAVINFTHIMREDFDEMLGDPKLQDEFRLYLERTASNSDKLLTLINNILDISRIESGNFSYHFVNTSLNTLFIDAVKRIRPKAEEKGLAIETDIPAKELWAYVDPRRLFQVLLNLLANAVKFTDRGKIFLDVKENGKTIDVLLRDTGRGIPREMHDAIFHSFTQVDRFDEGTGLGLGLVKMICKEMKIRIEIDSEIGRGSMIRLAIPVADS